MRTDKLKEYYFQFRDRGLSRDEFLRLVDEEKAAGADPETLREIEDAELGYHFLGKLDPYAEPPGGMERLKARIREERGEESVSGAAFVQASTPFWKSRFFVFSNVAAIVVVCLTLIYIFRDFGENGSGTPGVQPAPVVSAVEFEVDSVKGDAMVQSLGGGWRKAIVGEKLPQGTEIRTNGGAEMVIEFPGNNYITVAERTRFLLVTGTAFELKHGRVDATLSSKRSAKASGGPSQAYNFRFQSGSAWVQEGSFAAIQRGSEIFIEPNAESFSKGEGEFEMDFDHASVGRLIESIQKLEGVRIDSSSVRVRLDSRISLHCKGLSKNEFQNFIGVALLSVGIHAEKGENSWTLIAAREPDWDYAWHAIRLQIAVSEGRVDLRDLAGNNALTMLASDMADVEIQPDFAPDAKPDTISDSSIGDLIRYTRPQLLPDVKCRGIIKGGVATAFLTDGVANMNPLTISSRVILAGRGYVIEDINESGVTLALVTSSQKFFVPVG
ncbi:MAG: hypothetical protein NUW37_15720 [Planctomycetes bacterium]|nr:hypothetical protein [Planctomycetota bacterium]